MVGGVCCSGSGGGGMGWRPLSGGFVVFEMGKIVFKNACAADVSHLSAFLSLPKYPSVVVIVQLYVR